MLWWTLQQLKSSNPDVRMKAICLLGPSPRDLGCSGLRTQAAEELRKLALG
jgi:hypothetical protein